MKPAILRAADSPEQFTIEQCHVRELSNSTSDENVSVAQIRVAAGHCTRWHRLRDTQERYVVISGRGLMQLQNQAPQPVAAGDVVLIPPGCAQRIQALGDTELVFLAICTPRFVWAAYEDAAPGSTGPVGQAADPDAQAAQ